MLATLVRARGGALAGSWASAAALFAYAAAFSVAYLTPSTGTGALLLSGAVQVTMIGWGLAHGERFGASGHGRSRLSFGGRVSDNPE